MTLGGLYLKGLIFGILRYLVTIKKRFSLSKELEDDIFA